MPRDIPQCTIDELDSLILSTIARESAMDSTEKKKVKVIDSYGALIITFLLVGPFMLPLLWRNPRFSKKAKVIWSIILIAFTVGLLVLAPLLIHRFVTELLEAQSIQLPF